MVNSASLYRFGVLPIMMKPVNPYFFPVLCCAAVANIVVNAVDDGKSDTVPANPLGQMVSVAVSSTASLLVVGTVVMHTIIDEAYETWLGQTSHAGDGASGR